MEWLKTIRIKDLLSIIFIKGLGYTLLVVLMCVPFVTYPIIQDWFFEHELLPKIDTSLYGPIMGLIPLLWISLVGLVISWINTISYCIIDIDGSNRLWNIFLAIAAIIIIVGIVIVCSKGYYEVRCLLSNCNRFAPEVVVKQIHQIFQTFNGNVAHLTWITFIFYLFIDGHDIIYSQKKKEECSDEQTKELLTLDLNFSWLQLLLIDFSVLLSSYMLWSFSNDIDYSYLPTVLCEGEFYKNVFMTGAWGILIVFSQLVFYILTMRYYYQKQIIEKKYEKT